MKLYDLTKIIPVFACLMAMGCANSLDNDNSFKSDWQLTDHIELTPTDRSVLDGIDDFSYRLMVKASELSESGDFCVSPVSVSVLLSMLANATAGDCRAQILSALGQEDIVMLNATSKKLMQHLPCEEGGSSLAVANRFWVADRYSVPMEFSEAVGNTFNAQVDLVDFNKPSTVPSINKWVYDNTFGKISGILEGDWSEYVATDMISANTVYFKGNWAKKFNREKTVQGTFISPKGMREVDMMHGQMVLVYYVNDFVEAIDLGFDGGKNKMTLFLPKEGMDIVDALSNLSSDERAKLRKSAELCDVSLSMPYFSYEADVRLQEILNDMGLTGLKSADLSPMNLGVSHLMPLHKTTIRVDEDGAELAAVSAVVGETVNVVPDRRKISMDFNRPFLYMIQNYATGAILMAGAVEDPQ